LTADGATATTASPRPAGGERRLPPVAEVATAALVLIVIGGIFISAYAPRKAPLAFPTVLAALAIALTLWIAFTLVRLDFARARFLQVFKWALLAYVIEAGMLVYVFVHDDVPGKTLALLLVKLGLFATDVPVIIAYTVARHDRTGGSTTAAPAS
jgi:hypothetical protein